MNQGKQLEILAIKIIDADDFNLEANALLTKGVGWEMHSSSSEYGFHAVFVRYEQPQQLDKDMD